METTTYRFPAETPDIIERLKRRDWIIHSFPISDLSELYQPATFSYNVDQEQVEYILCLDTNIYQFLLSSQKKSANENTRDAVALLVFCQICDIKLDPTYAVYEKIGYLDDKAVEVVEDIGLFREIDNADTDALIKYAVGKENEYKRGTLPPFDKNEMAASLTKNRRLAEWDSLYLIILVCVSIAQEKSFRKEKLRKFVRWMWTDFRKSFVCLVYAAIYFSQRPIKRMMKYRHGDSSDLKRGQINNMTWDLYIMNRFFRNWTEKDSKTEYIFASDDKAFKDLLRLGIEVQIAQGCEPFRGFVSDGDFQTIEKIFNESQSGARIYGTDAWTPEYRQQQIDSFEAKLGISSAQ